MQRTVSKRLQLVEPTVEAARAAASGTFKDAPTSSVLTLNPVPFSCLFHLNATAYLYPVVLAAFPLTQWDPMELTFHIFAAGLCAQLVHLLSLPCPSLSYLFGLEGPQL